MMEAVRPDETINNVQCMCQVAEVQKLNLFQGLGLNHIYVAFLVSVKIT
jgi:hypothetical protein